MIYNISLFFYIVVFSVLSCSEKTEKKEAYLSSNTVQNRNDSEFILFWNNFENSIINSDTIALHDMISFPLKIRGIYDEDPIIIVSEKSKLINAFKFFYQTSDFSEFKNNKFDIIYFNNKNRCRIGNMELKKVQEEWKIEILYFNTQKFLNENTWEGEIIYKEENGMEEIKNALEQHK